MKNSQPIVLTFPLPGKAARWMTSHETAKYLSVAVRTVQLWVETGVLPAARTPGGHRRIPVEAVEALAASTGLNGISRRGAPQAGREAPPAPVLTEQVALSPTAASTANLPAPRDVLVVEDNPAQLLLWVTTLEIFGAAITLRTATNGYEGLLAVGSQRPDVLVTDLMMPGLDGFKMIKTLRASPSVGLMEIIVITGLTAREIEHNGGLPPGVVLLTKPVSPAGLVSRVDAALERIAGLVPAR